MIGKVLWEEFFNNRDWPVASAVAVILLLILIIPIILFQRNEQKQREADMDETPHLVQHHRPPGGTGAGLRLPLPADADPHHLSSASTSSKLVTVWAGFSTKWYGELLQNEAFLNAAWVTLKVAVISSTFATVLGTMARAGAGAGRAFHRPHALLRHDLRAAGHARGDHRPVAAAACSSASGWIAGVFTIVLAHTTFSMCYVSVVVSSRLVSFDRSLEEAALDLGCSPMQAFRLVTLPIIAPAVISGWLLAFTLSLDDLVIASFTAGPSATTLADENLEFLGAPWRLTRDQRALDHHDCHRCRRGDLRLAGLQTRHRAPQSGRGTAKPIRA